MTSANQNLRHILTGPKVMNITSTSVGPNISPNNIYITFALLHFKRNFVCQTLNGFTTWSIHVIFFISLRNAAASCEPNFSYTHKSEHQLTENAIHGCYWVVIYQLCSNLRELTWHSVFLRRWYTNTFTGWGAMGKRWKNIKACVQFLVLSKTPFSDSKA